MMREEDFFLVLRLSGDGPSFLEGNSGLLRLFLAYAGMIFGYHMFWRVET